MPRLRRRGEGGAAGGEGQLPEPAEPPAGAERPDFLAGARVSAVSGSLQYSTFLFGTSGFPNRVTLSRRRSSQKSAMS